MAATEALQESGSLQYWSGSSCKHQSFYIMVMAAWMWNWYTGCSKHAACLQEKCNTSADNEVHILQCCIVQRKSCQGRIGVEQQQLELVTRPFVNYMCRQ